MRESKGKGEATEAAAAAAAASRSLDQTARGASREAATLSPPNNNSSAHPEPHPTPPCDPHPLFAQYRCDALSASANVHHHWQIIVSGDQTLLCVGGRGDEVARGGAQVTPSITIRLTVNTQHAPSRRHLEGRRLCALWHRECIIGKFVRSVFHIVSALPSGAAA